MMKMEKINTLGLYDSGLGGYSIYQAVEEAYPHLNLTLYADQKNAPYGNKTNETIIDLAMDAMKWFETQGIHHVLIACNTVSAVALGSLQNAFPNMTIFGIIDLTVSGIESNNVAVISTKATYLSNAYVNALKSKGIEVKSKATPDLVAYIEGLEDPSDYLEHELDELYPYEGLILACTHYPLVLQTIQKFYPGTVYDSRQPILDFLSDKTEHVETPHRRIVTTGNPSHLKAQIKKLFGILEEVEGNENGNYHSK